MKLAGTAVAVFLFVAGQANGDTAGEMAKKCELFETVDPDEETIVVPETFEIPEAFQAGECWGAFRVVQEFATTDWAGVGVSLLGSCPPEDSRRSELVQVFLDHMHDYPGHGEADFAEIVQFALFKKFPCE